MANTEHLLEWPPLQAVPSKLEQIVRQAQFRLEAYYIDRAQESLGRWREALEAIIHDKRFKHAEPIFRAGIMYRYGIALQWNEIFFGRGSDFFDAKQYWSDAATLVPSTSAISLRSRYNLAIAMIIEHRISGQRSPIRDAVAILRKCTLDVSEFSPEASLCFEGLSLALERQYITFGDSADLSGAIFSAERSLQLMVKGSPRAARYMSRLATVLKLRHELLGDLADIDRAIILYREIQRRVPEGSVDWLAFLPDSAAAWRARFDQLGNLEDLLTAADIGRKQLSWTVPNSTNYEIALNSTGISLTKLFEARGRREDIDSSIDCLRRSISTLKETHPHYATNLLNLGNALLQRYHRYRDLDDLGEAIQNYRKSVERTPTDSSSYTLRVCNLGTALIDEYTNSPSSSTASEIDELLGISCERGLRVSPGIALRAAFAWGQWHEREGRFEKAGRSYGYGLLAGLQLFRQQDTRVNKVTRIRQIGLLPISAAFCRVKAGGLAQAVLAIEQGRALLLTEVLERDAADLDRLSHSNNKDLVTAYREAVLAYALTIRRFESAG